MTRKIKVCLEIPGASVAMQYLLHAIPIQRFVYFVIVKMAVHVTCPFERFLTHAASVNRWCTKRFPQIFLPTLKHFTALLPLFLSLSHPSSSTVAAQLCKTFVLLVSYHATK